MNRVRLFGQGHIWTGSALNIENQLIELGEKKGWKLCENETTKIVTELSRCSGV
jgi:hypothetical protein